MGEGEGAEGDAVVEGEGEAALGVVDACGGVRMTSGSCEGEAGPASCGGDGGWNMLSSFMGEKRLREPGELGPDRPPPPEAPPEALSLASGPWSAVSSTSSRTRHVPGAWGLASRSAVSARCDGAACGRLSSERWDADDDEAARC